MSFNRTFMELKLRVISNTVTANKAFQSYLYGIEIPALVPKKRVGQTSFNRTFMELKLPTAAMAAIIVNCFNRTFMELKFKAFRLPQPHLAMFQSYLYGIEITSAEPATIAQVVSIVPLWN